MNVGKKAELRNEGDEVAFKRKSAFKRNMDFAIISLGGSLVVPGEIDVHFLKQFRSLILSHVKRGHRFIIIVGGGKTCRKYQAAAKAIASTSPEDLDWLGIHSTRLNAHLLRTIFRDVAYPAIIKDPNKKIHPKEPVIVAAGWKPGCSTDYDAVILARNFKARTILNLSDIDYVCTGDPDTHKSAKPIRQMSWGAFRKLVGNTWHPGLSAPFDPVASGEAQRLGLRVAIMNGRNIPNIRSFLEGKKFNGTIIEG